MMKEALWSGKSKGRAGGYRFFIFLIRHTPIRIPYFFSRIVALYYLVFSDKNAIRYYFREIHGNGRLLSLCNIYRSYCLMGETLVDRVALLSGAEPGFTFHFEGEEYLHEMSEANRGGVLVGAHMGNWEIAGQLLERIRTPVNIVMLEAEREAIRKILEEAMIRRNIRVIPQEKDYSHLFRIDEALKRKEFVVMHGDRYLPGTNTLPVRFMGREARFPTGPLYLASKHRVPVSFVFTLKETRTHYHFYATPGKVYPYPSRMKTRKDELQKMVESYAKTLEQMVRKYPTQWFNYYHFWNEEK
jgi:predicted LPLAT superfamily acyltransferase